MNTTQPCGYRASGLVCVEDQGHEGRHYTVDGDMNEYSWDDNEITMTMNPFVRERDERRSR